MSPEGQIILDNLVRVTREREQRAREAGLDARVTAVKHYQHARFERTYADLLSTPRYARSARFFLEDLYGPHDFTQRDAQFARVVPGLVRLFPHEIVLTVRSLSELHAISEEFDTRMARTLDLPTLDRRQYLRAWQQAGDPAGRSRQIELMLAVGQALDRYTRHTVLRHSLRLMRGPARAAGLGALQNFLETGFDTFRDMRGAGDFLNTIATRERVLADALFAADPEGPLDALGQLP